MTIPVIVMIVSWVIWMYLKATPQKYDMSPFVDTCRILFAVSAFWVLATLSGRSLF